MRKFYHNSIRDYDILVIDWKTDKVTTLKTSVFKSGFPQNARDWFNKIVTAELPEAVKIYDRTLTGFHFEMGDTIIELQ